MKKIACLILIGISGVIFRGYSQPAVNKISYFEYKDVKLLPSPFLSAMAKDAELLNAIEPDRFLSGFRSEAGLEPKAPKYEGWESQGVAGQSFGHYLTAYSIWYAYSGDKGALEKLNYCVDELELCQKQHGDGYIAAIPDGKRIFTEVASGNIYSKGFDLNGGWVPVYVIHKLLAGLMDVYTFTGNKKALTLANDLAGFIYNTFNHLSEEQIQLVLDCEHGGIKESMANMYSLTKDKRYIELSNKFTHKAITDPLSKKEDRLAGLHANTQVPKMVASARYYELTKNPADSVIASFFWETVTKNHTYVNGGNSDGEHFGECCKLSDRLSLVNSETCNSYNMLKLTGHLFSWNPEMKYADFYERCMYNHILATLDPETGTGMYYTPLVSGAKKAYLSFNYPVCCSGTSMENHVKYNRFIYGKNEKNDLLINLFVPSVLNWQEKKVKVTQFSQGLAANKSELLIETGKPQRFRILIRNPHWSEKTTVLLNGKEINYTYAENGYIQLENNWKNGDNVTLLFDMNAYTVAMPDNPERVGIFYGPLLLAADLGEKDINHETDIPVIINKGVPVKEWLTKTSGYPLRFRMNVAQNPPDVNLVPFYTIHNEYYQVYWDVFNEQQWEYEKEKYTRRLKEIRELEKITLDYCVLGEMQPERDHNFQGEATPHGLFNKKKYRATWIDGWFSIDMKVRADQPVDLLITYWGSESGTEEFELLIDDRLLVTEQLSANQENDFYSITYSLPEEWTKGKDKVTVRFRSLAYKMVPKIFDCRTVKKSE